MEKAFDTYNKDADCVSTLLLMVKLILNKMTLNKMTYSSNSYTQNAS